MHERAGRVGGRVPRATAPVVITADSGTGKERLAEAIVRPRGARQALRALQLCSMDRRAGEASCLVTCRGRFHRRRAITRRFVRRGRRGPVLLDEVSELALPLQGSFCGRCKRARSGAWRDGRATWTCACWAAATAI